MTNSSYCSYGKALFDLIGSDKKQIVSYQEALNAIKDDLENHPELLSFLSSYAIPKEKQFDLIDKLYQDMGLKHLCPFLKVLADRRLFSNYEEIFLSFKKVANEALGKEEGIVYSAKPLTEEEIASLERSISKRMGKDVSLSERVEPSLLGGVKVFVGGKAFDGTLKGKIEKLRKELLQVAKGRSAI